MRRPLLVALFFLTAFAPRAGWPQGGTPLGPEFRVNTYTTSFQRYPSVAVTSGGFVVVWRSLTQDGSGEGVFGQRYASSGASLGPEFRVNGYTALNQLDPSVAADASGNFVVVWSSLLQDGWGSGVFGQRYSGAGEALGPEFRVNTFTINYQEEPSVVADPSGNFVVVWRDSGQGIMAQRYASSGTPLGSEFRVNTFATLLLGFPTVASDAPGNFVVTWWTREQDGSSFGIFGQRYASSGAPLGPEFRVNTYTTGAQLMPSVASDASGNFVVVWGSNNQDGSNWGVFGQRYASSGVPLGPEFRVNTYTTHHQRFPSVAGDASGNFVVAWHSALQEGPGLSYGVFAQRYGSSGAPLGLEFRINTTTTGIQVFPAVATDASGNFVVVWEDEGLAGSTRDIFGQRYGQIVPAELMHLGVE